MKNEKTKSESKSVQLWGTGISFLLFIAFTIAVKSVDVKHLGPDGGIVGLATINQFVFSRLGVNMLWYEITEWIGIVAVLVAASFAGLGMYQLVKERSLRKVDGELILLGGFYCLIMAFYVLFEVVVINYRPIIMDGELEASYPSSHGMLVICILVTAMMQMHRLLSDRKRLLIVADSIAVLLIAVTIIGRLLSGVHWITDIVGSVLLSVALVMLYRLTVHCLNERDTMHR